MYIATMFSIAVPLLPMRMHAVQDACVKLVCVSRDVKSEFQEQS
jgi:hypothetical protein